MEDGKAEDERTANGSDEGGGVEEGTVVEERPEGKTEARGKAEERVKKKDKDVASVGRQTIGQETAQRRERPKEEEKAGRGAELRTGESSAIYTKAWDTQLGYVPAGDG